MNEEFRQQVIETLRRGDELPTEWARILFPPERREYELVYYGKEREEDIIADTMGVPLQPVSTFGKNGDGWHNHLVFGDNLQVMKTLLTMKEEGKLINADGSKGVRLIYIDPPFATRREFAGSQEQKAYQDKIVGAEFLEFLRKRLILIRELLSSDGSLFLHTDQRKASHLKVILDEVFGEENFRNEIVLPGRASKNVQQQFSSINRLNVRHDTLFWYSSSTSTRFSPLWVEKHKMEHPDGRWHHFWSNADRPTMRYELFGHTPQTGQWTWKKERAERAVENYKRYLKEGGGRTVHEYWRDTGTAFEFIRESPDDGTPQYWRSPADTRLADTVWSGVRVYNNSTNYPTEKHEALLAQVIELASSEGDVVLDAFAGSGTAPAVAEKLGRRWIALDCGKLSIYTIQKRMLTLLGEIGNSGEPLKPKPFVVYNAGLYDFSTLKQLPWKDWRFFALQLFNCKDEPHRIGGMKLDGKLKGASVLVWNHLEHGRKRIDEDTIHDIHIDIGGKIGQRFFVIAPKGIFDFQQNYVEFDDVRYYALRIPYSVISELHHREFTALQQPSDEHAVNETVDSVGFDFIQAPTVEWEASIGKRKGGLFQEACISIKRFESRARIRGEDARGGLETFSMLMLDFDYNGEVFDFDAVFFAQEMRQDGWQARFSENELGEKTMAVFIDIYGNEARELILREKFGGLKPKVSEVPDHSSKPRRKPRK